MIGADAARQIATDWHGGQGSPLYAFASSGELVEGLEEEIQDNMKAARRDANGPEYDRLYWLLEFVEALREGDIPPDFMGDEDEDYADWDREQRDQYGAAEILDWQPITFNDAGVGFQAWSRDSFWVSQVYQSGDGSWTWKLHYRGELIAEGDATSADQARQDAQTAMDTEIGLTELEFGDSYYQQPSDPNMTSGDSQSVNFSQMTEEQNREMELWEKMLRRSFRQIFAVDELPEPGYSDDEWHPYDFGIKGRGWRLIQGDWTAYIYSNRPGGDYESPYSDYEWYWVIDGNGEENYGVVLDAGYGSTLEEAQNAAADRIETAEIYGVPDDGYTDPLSVSPDSQSVNFSQMTEEQQREMDEWDKIFKTRRSKLAFGLDVPPLKWERGDWDDRTGWVARSPDGAFLVQVYDQQLASGVTRQKWRLDYEGEWADEGYGYSEEEAKQIAKAAYEDYYGMLHEDIYGDDLSPDAQSMSFADMSEEAEREMEEWNKMLRRSLREIFASAEALYGAGNLDAMFGGAPKVMAPWPSGSTKNKKGVLYDKAKLKELLESEQKDLTPIDPRTLRATQPWVTRAGVDYYLNGKYEETGDTYADPYNAGNVYPVVWQDPNGNNVILTGHHRAAAALLRGEPLLARVFS